MANHASALKAHRQSLRRKERNRANRSSLRTTLKKFSERLQAGQVEELKASLPTLYASIDKAVQKKALSKNAAARQKSLLTRHLNKALANSAKS
jgi:small subunit ribosomal protein S20